ncbi:MAG: hypothetical protein JKY11_08835 [Alphaproteobacteria bacterium]|nr:hypothetical protein [Alphaproteobacteria bacterium]
MSDEFNNKLVASDRDGIIPLDFFDVLVNRYFPILSCTYVATVLGLALKKGGVDQFLEYFLADKSIYWMALIVSGWVSIPAIIWIFMRGTGALETFANNWYKSTTIMMVSILIGSFLLFPPSGQANIYWATARLFIVAAIPVHVIQYWFFRHGGLETVQSTTLGALALALMMYGLFVL